jgi:beta-lactamase class A
MRLIKLGTQATICQRIGKRANVRLEDDYLALCDEAGVTAAVHVRSVQGDREWGFDEDRISVAASTYKVPVLLELACQYDEGLLEPTQRVRIPATNRCLGPTGISAMLDDVEMSLRDLSLLMIQVSDNTATDVLQELVTTARVNERLAALGQKSTVIRGDCAALLGELLVEFGIPWPYANVNAGIDLSHLQDLTPASDADVYPRSKVLHALTGNTTTPSDMTSLLRQIWRDEAGSPAACAEVRRIMAMQYAPHRLATAYDDGPTIAGKTGTLLGGITNEIGVIDFGAGEAFAVAVYLRKLDRSLRNAAADRAVGAIARLVVDALRA